MRRLACLIFLVILNFLCTSKVDAQQRTIAGKVIGENNQPLAGATIRIKGTDRFTQTDATGSFSIKANKGETIEISHVGYEASSSKIGDSNSISVSLKTSANTMSEVTVVAMDIKRNPKELGYSAQKVSGDQIAQTQRVNFLNSLQGRVAGLSIVPTSGAAGASSQIVLRGFNSLTLNNQPLFIVDGVILDNSTLNETSNGGTSLGLASDRANRTSDYTNRIADLNPADIESVTILKGPEATALYGSQASSGAVVITTKKAVPGRTSIQYDNNFRASFVTRYADLNNDYTIGNNGVATTTPPTTNGSTLYFGPAYPAGTQKYNNIDNFFRTGFAQTHNVTADFGTKNAGFRVSSSYYDENGVIPNNEFTKFNIRLANTTKIGKYVSVSPAFQYIYSINDKPIRGAGGYLLDLYDWPANNDVRNYVDAQGYKTRILATDFNTEVDNPLFSVYNNHGQDKTDRYLATLGLDINPWNWLTVAGRFGFDHYYQRGYGIYHPMSYYYTAATGGYLDDYYKNYNGYNHTITATAHKSFGKFAVRLMLGTMWQDYKTEMWAVSGQNLVDSVGIVSHQMWKNGQVVTPDQYNQLVANPYDSTLTKPGATRLKLSRNVYGEANESRTEQLANFGSVQVAFNNYLFLEYTHRFESSSLFTKDNRNYNYPGLSFSAVVTDMLPKLKGKILDFAKLRLSLAGTARQPYPYLNQSVFVNNLQSSAVGTIYSYGFQNNNPALKPERQRTWSVGTELRFVQNRVNLDVTYYNTYAYDQIAQNFRASYGTGFVLNTQNAASLRNEGIEIVAGLDIIRQSDLTWNMQLNFNHMWSKVLTLPQSIGYEMYLSDTWLYGNARVGFIRDHPATTITSYHYTKNNQGKLLISPSTGLPMVDGVFTVAGDRNPDFTLGIGNNLRYKNWSLSFLWDLRVGGDIFNGTEMYLTSIGKSTRTSDRMTPRVIDGVLNDGLQNTANPTPNSIVVVPYYQSSYYTSMPEEEFIQHDVDWFRLRDLTLTYNLPQQTIKRFKAVKRLSVFVTGTDLVLFTNYRGADPAVNGNTAGEGGISAYGFDYGVMPAPVSLSFGFRVNF
jgi:TonB-linked SusC/RagA family outer membrane protein